MLKLSILIPLIDPLALEATLVSVLQNRPHDCEIVVLHDGLYQDPYGLSGEVRFVTVPAGTSMAAMVARGVETARGAVVHPLACGAETIDGWADAALVHFAQADVAAVATIVVARDRSHVDSAGLDYRRGGARVARLHGEPLESVSTETVDVLGPVLLGGFYRRSFLGSLTADLCAIVGDDLVDAELALNLAHSGQRAVLEPRSHVIAAPATPRIGPLSEAWLCERLFWRHAAELGLGRSMVAHLGVVAGDVACGLLRPWQASRLLGRAAGAMEHLLRGRTRATRGRLRSEALAATGPAGRLSPGGPAGLAGPATRSSRHAARASQSQTV